MFFLVNFRVRGFLRECCLVRCVSFEIGRGKKNGEWATAYNVIECSLDEFRCGCTPEEKRLFGVLDGFGLSLFEGTLGAGVAGFSASILAHSGHYL